MNIAPKALVFLIMIVFVIGASVGYQSKPEKVRVETKTEIKEVLVQDEARTLNQVQRIIEKTRPDGTKIKKTRIETKAAAEIQTVKESEARLAERRDVKTERRASISALVGLPLTEVARGPVFGAAIQKPLLGPFLIGVWGFTDLRFGASIGLDL